MNPARKLKNAIPPGLLDLLVKAKKQRQARLNRRRGIEGAIRPESDTPWKLYGVPGKNVFFGYYDLQQFDAGGRRLLAHIVDRNADPRRDRAALAVFDRDGDVPHPFAETAAWCWQQGARLRWDPTCPDCVLYNDCEGGRYVLKRFDLNAGTAQTLSRAVYDVTPDGRVGIALDFGRLQRLRAGYGYCAMGEGPVRDPAPADDGVYRVDLETGAEKLLFSLADLAKDVPGHMLHYINHISVSPSGKRFIFFHLWTPGPGKTWYTRLYVSDIDGAALRLLEGDKRVSHYCWLDDDRLVITTGEGLYYTLDARTGAHRLIESSRLTRDGHPSPVGRGILTDTYPLRDSTQRVFTIDLEGRNAHELLTVYSDPRRYGERRCDLHPRVRPDGVVTIDTTARGGVRSVLQFRMNYSED